MDPKGLIVIALPSKVERKANTISFFIKGLISNPRKVYLLAHIWLTIHDVQTKTNKNETNKKGNLNSIKELHVYKSMDLHLTFDVCFHC